MRAGTVSRSEGEPSTMNQPRPSTTTTMRQVEVPADLATTTAVRALRRLGASPSTAGLVATELVSADLTGYPSHGIMRLLEYRRTIYLGKLKPTAVPTTERVSERVYLVDGE